MRFLCMNHNVLESLQTWIFYLFIWLNKIKVASAQKKFLKYLAWFELNLCVSLYVHKYIG